MIKLAYIEDHVVEVDMIALRLLNSPMTVTATVLRESISLKTLTISLCPHVTCQCYRLQDFSFLPRMLTGDTAVVQEEDDRELQRDLPHEGPDMK